MISSYKAYMRIRDVEQKLRLSKITCSQRINSGSYRVLVDNEWIDIFANEPRINTSGPPIRAVELHAKGSLAEHLITLELELPNKVGWFQMQSEGGETIDIAFERQEGSFFLHGEFLIAKKGVSGIDFHIALPNGKEIIGYGAKTGSNNRCKFYVEEMRRDDRIALIRSVAEHKDLVLEQVIRQL